jgi:ribosomal protein S24E
MGRREVTFEIQEPATPSRSEVRREIALLLKTDLDNVWVKRLETHTGTHRTVGLAHIYESAEAAMRVEPEHTILRNKTPGKEPEPEE